MALCKSTEEQLEEVYESRKTYLNHENECEELHEMCNKCIQRMKCRESNKACRELWMEWLTGKEVEG